MRWFELSRKSLRQAILFPPDRVLGKPSSAQKRLQPLNSFACKSQRQVPSSAASIASAPRFSLSSKAAADSSASMRRRWAISRAITRPSAMASPTLAAVPPNNSRNERDTGAFSSATGTPTCTDHPSVPARTRWTVSTSMPSLRLSSRRIRAAARDGFLNRRCFRVRTGGLCVSGVRATILSLASITVPAQPAGSPA